MRLELVWPSLYDEQTATAEFGHCKLERLQPRPHNTQSLLTTDWQETVEVRLRHGQGVQLFYNDTRRLAHGGYKRYFYSHPKPLREQFAVSRKRLETVGKRALVFIDTNVYLDFYRINLPNYRSLLEYMGNIREHIFVSAMIRNECERNRLSAYEQGNQLQDGKAAIALGRVNPHHSDDPTAIDELNKEIRSFQQEVSRKSKDFHRRISEEHNRNLRAILHGEDDVSRALEPIFCKAALETEDQLARARKRKEYGQPPGKKNDPLGDQLTWEQLLDYCKGCDLIFLVSRDDDYFEYIEKQPYLRSTLFRELRERGVSEANCFTDVASFFKAFKDADVVPHGSLPAKEVVEAAQKEVEESSAEEQEWRQSVHYKRRALEQYLAMKRLGEAGLGGEIVGGFPSVCPRAADGLHRVGAVSAKPSRFYTGWTMQGPCSLCGELIDTGEPYDD